MILLTGGTGRTSQYLAPLLEKANQNVLLTSRSGTVESFRPPRPVLFDWENPSTYQHPFTVAGSDHIDRVFLVLPPKLGTYPHVNDFIDFAISKGVIRFVLLSATVCAIGESDMGRVHEYLIHSGVQYCILRPTWFHENFTTEMLDCIRNENTLYSASGDGKIPWIAVEDIAREACSALLSKGEYPSERIILGPDLYSFSEAAKILSDILGRNITHTQLSESELADYCIAGGLQKEWGEYLSWLDTGIAAGSEERVFQRPDKVTGTIRLPDFLKANREHWMVSNSK